MNATFTYSLEKYSRDRKSLLPLLFAAQSQQGHLSPELIRRIAERTGLTDNQVFSFASFFPWLRLQPDDGSEVALTSGPVGRSAGAGEDAPLPTETGQVRVATRRPGQFKSVDFGDYLGHEGFLGLEKALAAGPEVLEEMVEVSGVDEADDFGLGCRDQWRACRQTTADAKYLICSAVADDPYSLIESSLLENDPFRVVEGMLLAGYASGASHGILCLDGRRPSILSRLGSALEQVKISGRLGDGALGSSFNFHIEIIPAAGPAPCGEAQRVIAALEGTRPDTGFARGGSGPLTYMGRPAVVHCLETLAKLPAILGRGAEWYAGLGRNGHRGTKLVTLAGNLLRQGLAELPLGTPFGEIINQVGGGVPGSQTFKAIQVGGPIGGWLGAADLNLALSQPALAAAGMRLGSGSLLAVDQGACAVDLAWRSLQFATEQSCGHCNICREGTRQMAEILHDIIAGRSRPNDPRLLEELSETLRQGSSCRLGRTAPQAFLTTLQRFPEEYQKHLKQHQCAAGSCLGGVQAPDSSEPQRHS